MDRPASETGFDRDLGHGLAELLRVEQTNDQQRGVHQELQHAPRDQIGQQCEKDQPAHQAAALEIG